MTPSVAPTSVDALKRVSLFSDLGRKELESVADSMRERTFGAGDTVTAEGSGGAGFFVVDEGEADVVVDGQKRGTIKAGDHFGEIALLTGSERTATIVATTQLRCYGL